MSTLPDIRFIKGQGGLGRALPGQDYISAFAFYTTNLPAGFTTTSRIKALYALSDAESAGITDKSIGETPATGSYNVTGGAYVNVAASATLTITAIGADGDTIQPKAGLVDISALVTKTSSETTPTLLATKVKNAINTATSTNGGYSATSSGAVITITGPLADGAGINGTAVAPTIVGTITFTSVAFSGGVNGVVGDTLTIKVTEPNEKVVTIATYTKPSTAVTSNLIASGIATAINAGTISHGYSAAAVSAAVNITARPGLGIFLNTGTNLAATVSAGSSITGTIDQFAGGVASEINVFHYHISEFFRIQPKGVLYVGFFPVPGTYTFAEITTMQSFANGTLRQIGIYKEIGSAFSTGDLTLIDTVCKANDEAHKPISAIYAADLSGTADISVLTDLSLLTANKATAVISQDGGGLGNYLWLTTGKSITNIGALLGTVALTKVSVSVAWVGQYNISNGSENEVLAFANGQLFSDVAITDNLLEALNVKRYVFLKKFTGLSGSFWNDGHTAIIVSSDYAYIENNRTIDKAIRGIRTNLLPSLNSPLTLNADGTLAETTVAFFESQAGISLDQMVRDQELSAYLVTVNPAQNVLSTSKLVVAVTLVINGVARQIEIPIGFKPSIA